VLPVVDHAKKTSPKRVTIIEEEEEIRLPKKKKKKKVSILDAKIERKLGKAQNMLLPSLKIVKIKK
jgi:hypothetical protein